MIYRPRMCYTVPTVLPVALACVWAVNLPSIAQAQVAPLPAPVNPEVVPRPPGAAVGLTPAPPRYPAPFSRHAQVRERQAVTRQLAVLDWTRWQANAWSLYGPDELWLFGPPLTFAWDFPPVEQPIGYQRIYDGRGGYSSGPVYADQLAPAPPPPHPRPVVPLTQPNAAEPVLGSREMRRSRVNEPAPQTAKAPRRLFSW
jgi:hypothetical protein